MDHRWELRSEEPDFSRKEREQRQKTLQEGLAGPFRKLYEESELAKPFPIQLRRWWECAHCGAKVTAKGRFEETHPGPKAILSIYVFRMDSILHDHLDVVIRRGKASKKRQYFNCDEFTVAAVHMH